MGVLVIEYCGYVRRRCVETLRGMQRLSVSPTKTRSRLVESAVVAGWGQHQHGGACSDTLSLVWDQHTGAIAQTAHSVQPYDIQRDYS